MLINERVLLGLDGNPFDWNRARADLHALIDRHANKRQTRNQAIPPRIKAIMAETMPDSCFAMGDNEPYVPMKIIKEAAPLIFRDQWNTQIIDTRVMAQGPMINDNQRNTSSEGRRNHLICQTTMRISVVSLDGTQTQSHEAIGLSGFDQRVNDPHYMKMYHVACRGSETAAMRAALARFGKLFSAMEDVDELEDAEQSPPPKAPTAQHQGKIKPKPLSRNKRPDPAASASAYTPPTSLPLYNEGEEYRNFPNSTDGAYQWISEREELARLSNSLTAMERNDSDNEAIFNDIQRQYGTILEERISDMRNTIDVRIATLTGIVETPKRASKRREKPLENAEITSTKTTVATETPVDTKTNTTKESSVIDTNKDTNNEHPPEQGDLF